MTPRTRVRSLAMAGAALNCLLLVQGCDNEPQLPVDGLQSAAPAIAAPPHVGSWQLLSVVRSPLPRAPDSTALLTIPLDPHVGLGLLTDCTGRASASYQVTESRLTVIGPWRSSAQPCDAEMQAQDAWLLKLIESRPTLKVRGDNLWVTAAEAEIVFSRE